ncbi:hypothetical protein CTI12_AA098270 [Artemisia annua]|uniref:peptidylprolyl isomerase n=1 Tax=Artemisia annua TaxID=35608 RepID=A0A2U1PUS4_ARTAN|nr:hypothetical protein CTI12_AA098270 [Artemisia annua]
MFEQSSDNGFGISNRVNSKLVIRSCLFHPQMMTQTVWASNTMGKDAKGEKGKAKAGGSKEGGAKGKGKSGKAADGLGTSRHILCEKQGKINEPYKKLQDGWLSNGDEVLPAEFAKRMWMDQWLSFKFYERTRVSHTITSTLLHIMKMVVALITETAADALPPMLLDIPKADTSSSVEENVATKIPVSSTTPPNTDELAEKSRLKTETGSTSVRKELFAGPDKELTGLDAKKEAWVRL